MSEKEYDVTITIRVQASSPEEASMKVAYALARGEAHAIDTKVRQSNIQVFQD